MSQPTEKDVNEYLAALMDAARQRSGKEELEKCARIASCIQEIYTSLKKYKVNKTDDIVHTLASVMVIPVMMIEPDPIVRANLMRQIAINFTRDIIFMIVRDAEIKNTESGRELDRLRNMVHDSEMLEPVHDNNEI